MNLAKVTLEQWAVLQAVVDYGGFAQAATMLHRSQSSVSYTIARMQEQLGSPLLEIVGRKAVLTEIGQVLLQQSRQLVQKANKLEQLAHSMQSGWEAEIHLVVDAAYPTTLLMDALRKFEPLSQGTRVQLKEVVLSGAEDAIREGSADLVISAFVPEGFLGEEIAEIEFIAVAHPSHPLHQQTTPISSSELSQSLHVIVSDSGHVQTRDVGWLSSEHRWNVAKMETAIEIISRGLGFGWLPSHLIQQQLQQGTLKALPLEAGQRYKAHLFFVKTQQEHTGPAAQTLADLFLRPTGGLPS